MINSERNDDEKLTVFTITGTTTKLELSGAIMEFYEDPTTYTIWDFRKCSEFPITIEESKTLFDYVEDRFTKAKRSRTAGVVSGLSDLGIARVFELVSQQYEFGSRFKVFEDMDRARNWVLGM